MAGVNQGMQYQQNGTMQQPGMPYQPNGMQYQQPGMQQPGVTLPSDMTQDLAAVQAAYDQRRLEPGFNEKKNKKMITKQKKAQKKQDKFIKAFLQTVELTPEDQQKVAAVKAGQITSIYQMPGDIQIVDTIFQQCDADADGTCDVKELSGRYGAVAENMLHEFDLDGGQTLSRDEFVHGLDFHYKNDPERTAKWIAFFSAEEQHLSELQERIAPETNDQLSNLKKQRKEEKKALKKEKEAAAKAALEAAEHMTPEEIAESAIEAAAISAQTDVRNHRAEKRDIMKCRSVASTRTDPTAMDWSQADASKWQFIETRYNGTYRFGTQPTMEEIAGPISEGIARVKNNPHEFQSVWFQTSMQTWPTNQQEYTLVHRNLGTEMLITQSANGGFTHLKAKYEVLPAKESVTIRKDRVTDQLAAGGFEGYRLREPLLPGRGEGVADVPTVKIMHDVDPSDVAQGRVGDCWLLSAISCLAEFDGAIHEIFERTEDLENKPSPQSNMYTVSLYDLPTGRKVNVEVDERLCNRSDGSGLLGAQPSVSGELWVPYLEKAIASHCGGWDKIDGGTCTHAWRILTGCEEQYTFKQSGGLFKAFGAFNPNQNKMEELENSPHDGFAALWPMKWPEVGGGGSMRMGLNGDQLFERMCAWEDAGFMMAAGTRSGSDSNDTDGIVDGHAYSILDVENDVGSDNFDMIKVRNPWGSGEMKSGKWDDDGPGWDQHPDVRAALNPVELDDGIFWLEKDEFFEYFHSVYLCAMDVSHHRWD